MFANGGAGSSPMQLLRLTDGLVLHLALSTAARLGIADVLADEACEAAEIAARLNLDERALFRMLRYLAGHGIFSQTAPRAFGNSHLSRWLRTGIPGSVRSILSFRGSGSFLRPLMDLPRAVCTGSPAHDGFEDLNRKPDERSLFDDAMSDLSAIWASSIAEGYDFGKCGSLLDLGGGSGLLLAAVLRSHPGLEGLLVDRPEVLERARRMPFWDGVADRIRFQAADFFQAVPAGCRCCLMKNVLHDWDDGSALRILINCRRALPDDGLLLLVEYSLGPDNTPSLGKMLDLVMLASIGGRERTVDEHRMLLASAGFVLTSVIPLPCDVMILEARPSGGRGVRAARGTVDSSAGSSTWDRR